MTVKLNHERPKVCEVVRSTYSVQALVPGSETMCDYRQVRWFRGDSEATGTEITASDKYEMVSDKTHRTLRIRNCTEADKGMYWCLVGDVKCSASMEIARE